MLKIMSTDIPGQWIYYSKKKKKPSVVSPIDIHLSPLDYDDIDIVYPLTIIFKIRCLL